MVAVYHFCFSNNIYMAGNRIDSIRTIPALGICEESTDGVFHRIHSGEISTYKLHPSHAGSSLPGFRGIYRGEIYPQEKVSLINNPEKCNFLESHISGFFPLAGVICYIFPG